MVLASKFSLPCCLIVVIKSPFRWGLWHLLLWAMALISHPQDHSESLFLLRWSPCTVNGSSGLVTYYSAGTHSSYTRRCHHFHCQWDRGHFGDLFWQLTSQAGGYFKEPRSRCPLVGHLYFLWRGGRFWGYYVCGQIAVSHKRISLLWASWQGRVLPCNHHGLGWVQHFFPSWELRVLLLFGWFQQGLLTRLLSGSGGGYGCYTRGFSPLRCTIWHPLIGSNTFQDFSVSEGEVALHLLP